MSTRAGAKSLGFCHCLAARRLWKLPPIRRNSPLESDVRPSRSRNTQANPTEVAVNSFSDFFWLLVWAFVLGCYLVILFQVFVDLFRDKDLSGWWKAVWVIFLIIAPFLSVLIYVIARGRGMAERRQEALGGGRRREEDVYVPPPIISIPNPAEQIESAQKLLDSGAISQAEFDQLKQKALA
jgi:hypothetical protein